jgi:uncharacterized protein (DUF1015 family)
MHISPLTILLPKLNKIKSLKKFCANSKFDFPIDLQKGCFLEFPEAGFFIYQIEMSSGIHTGLIAATEITDFDNGLIKKHEKTLVKRENEYISLLQTWKAVIKPVLLTYPAVPAISQWLIHFTQNNPPAFQAEFKKDHEQHRVWPVTQPEDIHFLTTNFRTKVLASYIADGHHRTTTIARLAKENHESLDFSKLHTVFFADDQLDILPYHRYVHLPARFNTEVLIANLQKFFYLTLLKKGRYPEKKREIILLVNHQVWSLIPKNWPDAQNPHLLDVTILNDAIFHEVLGIEDVRSSKEIGYLEGNKTLPQIKKFIYSQEVPTAAFLLFPVDFHEFYFVSDNHQVLPPKSTWFQPRIKSGLMPLSLMKKN